MSPQQFPQTRLGVSHLLSLWDTGSGGLGSGGGTSVLTPISTLLGYHDVELASEI